MDAPSGKTAVFNSLHEFLKRTPNGNEDGLKNLIEQVKSLKEAFRKQSIWQEACKEDCDALENVFIAARNHTDVVDKLCLYTELFGLMRNMCADCRHNQEMMGTAELFTTAFSCLEAEILEEGKETTDVDHHQQRLKCLRIGVQFLGNLVVNNNVNKKLVWKSLRIYFSCLLQSKDPTLAQYTTMVLYNCLASMRQHVNNLVHDADYSVAISKAVLQLLLEKENEWSLYFVELMLQSPSYFRRVFIGLPEVHRLLTLEVLEDCLSRSTPSTPGLDIAADNIIFLSEHLKMQSDCILQTSQENIAKLNPVEVLKTLDVLCSASAKENYRKILQPDSSLLIVVIHLLKSIHLIGKSGDNVFTPVEKLADAVNPSSAIATNPGYGMKRDLVRLIGNLCWEHKGNQDLIRECDGIALLLDCSKIDARNPFITQWVVFAIHNLCEDNAENQALIASMQPLGVDERSLSNECESTVEVRECDNRQNGCMEFNQSGPSCPSSEPSSSILHSSTNNTTTASDRAISDIQDLFM